MVRVITVAILLLAVVLATIAREGTEQEPRPSTLAGRSAVYAPNGAIATSQPLATAAGLAVLQRGGNAVDAAATAAAVLNLVEPHMTGIGGDMFAILWLSKEKRLVGLNSSGRAGSEMTREILVERGYSRVPGDSAEAITVPGALAGWAALLERHGTISLAEALAPAIRLAEEGFPVSPIIAGQWAVEVEKLRQDEGARATYLMDGRRAPRAGEWFRNPDFARTLRLVAEEGPGAFYGGKLGQRIVGRVRELGGFLTLDDLKQHKVEWVKPIAAEFQGYRLYELPPNGQGIAALEMLRILDPYDLRAMGHNSAHYLHHLVEAKKLAFADLRRYVGDPAHMTVPAEALLAEEFIRERRALLDSQRAADRPGPGRALTASETIYVAAADQEGNMVSFINSLFEAFGSGVVAPGTGFALQNRGVGFTLEPDHPNTVAPGKRPFHTLIPGFVTKLREDGGEEPWLAFGVMGGSMQPQGHVQVMLNMLLFGMDVQQAIDAPRFRHFSGRRLALEAPVGDDIREALARMGHEVIPLDTRRFSFGGGQSVLKLERGWAAGSDPRKDGSAMGH